MRSSLALRYSRLNLLPSDVDLRGGLIVDVGANRGDWTAAVLQVVPGADVVAIEPVQEIASELERRFQSEGSVEIVCCAAAEKAGFATFHLTEHDHGSSLQVPREAMRYRYEGGWEIKGQVEVATKTLDEIVCGRDVSLLKLDVQGAESRVLDGATATLEKTQAIIIEVTAISHYERDTTFPGLHLQLQDHGFELFGLSEPYRDVNGAVLWLDACYRPSAARRPGP